MTDAETIADLRAKLALEVQHSKTMEVMRAQSIMLYDEQRWRNTELETLLRNMIRQTRLFKIEDIAGTNPNYKCVLFVEGYKEAMTKIAQLNANNPTATPVARVSTCSIDPHYPHEGSRHKVYVNWLDGVENELQSGTLLYVLKDGAK